jgi:cytochrome c-type biogenesis protein
MSDAGLPLLVSGVNWGLFSWGLSGGIASFFSPCALPMLPAYLSYYVAADTDDARSSVDPVASNGGQGQYTAAPLTQGVTFGGVASFGMLVVFVLAAVVTGVLGDVLKPIIPVLIPVVGIIVIGLGVAMLADRANWLSRSVSLPEWKEPSARHFFGFGVLFALAALGCTAPIFIGITLTALSSGGFAGAATVFSGYAGGMVGMFVVLTGLVAFAKEETARQLRALIPYVERASAVLLIGAGGYMLYYYWQLVTL